MFLGFTHGSIPWKDYCLSSVSPPNIKKNLYSFWEPSFGRGISVVAGPWNNDKTTRADAIPAQDTQAADFPVGLVPTLLPARSQADGGKMLQIS